MLSLNIVAYFTLFCIRQLSLLNAVNIIDPIVSAEKTSQGTCPSIEVRDASRQNITNVVKALVSAYICESDTRCRYLGSNCGPGEWRQVAYLNMSDPTQQCPSAWREYNTGGVRACGRPVTIVGSCAQVQYPSNNSQYSRVCGRAIGYQYGTTDAFGNVALGRTIDSYYVYGVSFTHGSPRTHIWTLAAGLTERESISHAQYNCPCAHQTMQVPPLFVGNDYYCESGNPTGTYITHHLYSEDPLWDGGQCEGECCSNGKSPPWFSVELTNPTTDDIEVRICCPQGTFDDVAIQLMELYIQ